MGILTINGPEQAQNFTCTLGFLCTLPLTGYGLSASSELWLIGNGSCIADADAAEIEGLENPTGVGAGAVFELGIATGEEFQWRVV